MLSVGPSRSHRSTHDYQSYYRLAAKQYARSEDASDLIQAGQYSVWANQLEDAEILLRKAQSVSSWSDLAAYQQAQGWTYLGRAIEPMSTDGALYSYHRAIELHPDLAEPRLRFHALHPEASNILPIRPTYYLDEPVTLAGQTLVGYDVEEAAIEVGGFFDIWLWWQQPDSDKYHVLRRRVVNLASNPGFEWGAGDTPLPRGYFPMWAPEVVTTPIVLSRGLFGDSHLLSLSHDQGFVSIQTNKFLPQPDIFYLTSVWAKVKPSNRDLFRALAGISCEGQPQERYAVQLDEIADLQNMTTTWVHKARVVSVPVNQSALDCKRAFFTGYGGATWDRWLMIVLD
jgi:hypothetical protein